MEKLINILKSIKPHVDFATVNNLIENGILDSFDIIILVAEINEAFNINITPGDMLPEYFNNVNNIWSLINNLQ